MGALTGTKRIPISIGALIAPQWLFACAPFTKRFFGTVSLSLRTQARLVGGLVFFALVELVKMIIRLAFPIAKGNCLPASNH